MRKPTQRSRATLGSRGDYEGALAEAERALAISPNLAGAHATLGATRIFSGRPKEGLAALETSIRLDPYDPLLPSRLNRLALGLYFSGQYEAAVEAAKRAIRLNPRLSDATSLARRGARPDGSDRGSEGSLGEGHRNRTGLIRHVRPRARAVDAARGPRQHAGGLAQGRMEGLSCSWNR
jgi:tetratricopeptide (TPR) repeat protein